MIWGCGADLTKSRVHYLGYSLYSYRFTGIDRVVKVYSEKEYSLINWNAETIEYEEIKKNMMKIAVGRLTAKYEEKNAIEGLNQLLKDSKMKEGALDGVYNVEKYLISNYSIDEQFEYIIWSITQTADLVYELINSGWAKAKLVAVVDRIKRINYKGKMSESKDVIRNHKNALVLVCSDTAMKEAEPFFRENGIENYCYCMKL